jgi:hypothetical protein
MERGGEDLEFKYHETRGDLYHPPLICCPSSPHDLGIFSDILSSSDCGGGFETRSLFLGWFVSFCGLKPGARDRGKIVFVYGYRLEIWGKRQRLLFDWTGTVAASFGCGITEVDRIWVDQLKRRTVAPSHDKLRPTGGLMTNSGLPVIFSGPIHLCV